MEIELLWWVDDNLAGMPIPYFDPERRFHGNGFPEAYDDDLKYLVDRGIRSVVCLLNIPSDETIYKKNNIEFLCSPIKDYMPPSFEQMKVIWSFINNSPKLLAVHCEGGIGRTGTILAAYLIMNGMSFDNAVTLIRSKEPSAIESLEQMKFLKDLEGYSDTDGDAVTP